MVDQILFKFKEYVQLWQTGGMAPNINSPMIQYNTTIYKGANNTIDFVVRNNDRKPINLNGYVVEALIQRVEANQPIVPTSTVPMSELLLIKPVIITDGRSGTARLTLTDSDINHWLGGFYRYSIRLTDITGKQEFLYTDVNRSTYGTFELVEGLSVSLAPAIKIPASLFTPVNDSAYTYVNMTGAYPGDAQTEKANGMHTVVVYTSNNYIGQFWIQASLTTKTPTEQDWFDIQLTPSTDYFGYTLANSPPIQVFNLTGNYYWIRMYYKDDPTNKGSFDQVLYKN
jgi:hypothetical protein